MELLGAAAAAPTARSTRASVSTRPRGTENRFFTFPSLVLAVASRVPIHHLTRVGHQWLRRHCYSMVQPYGAGWKTEQRFDKDFTGALPLGLPGEAKGINAGMVAVLGFAVAFALHQIGPWLGLARWSEAKRCVAEMLCETGTGTNRLSKMAPEVLLCGPG